MAIHPFTYDAPVMIFRRRPQTSGPRSHHRGQAAGLLPVLHVLAPGQSPRDFQDPIEQSFPEPDVIISRAELDLRKSLQMLMVHTGSTVNSLELLAALQLPGSTAALFWAARLLLNQALVGELHDENLIRRTNHDARLLYQAIAQADLDPWYATVVSKAAIAALPAGLQFLPGHPIAGRYYRQHPLAQHRQIYLSVATYFADLFYERRQELIRLLGSLGAVRIQFENLAVARATVPEVLHYPDRPGQGVTGFNPADYPWLPYEPIWQRVAADRMNMGAKTATIDLTIDINGLIAAQVAALKNVMAQMDSVRVVYEDQVDRDYLQPQRVTVVFGG